MRSMRQLSGEKPEKRITIDTIWKQLKTIIKLFYKIFANVYNHNGLQKQNILK